MFGGAFAGGSMGGFDLGSMFSGGGHQAFRRGPDLQVRVRIPFRESVKGTQQELRLPMRDVTGRQTTRSVTVNIPAGAQTERCWGHAQIGTAAAGVGGMQQLQVLSAWPGCCISTSETALAPYCCRHLAGAGPAGAWGGRCSSAAGRFAGRPGGGGGCAARPHL